MSEEFIQETGEFVEATPAADESIDNEFDQAIAEDDPVIERAGSKMVPLDVVETMREQLKEQREQNQRMLQLILNNQNPQPQQPQQQQQQGFDIDDGEIITGAQLKAILQQQAQMSQQEIRQFQAEQKQAFIDEQKAAYQQLYPDYNDVLASVQMEAQKDPAIAELIMRSKNPVDAAYKYGKLIRGEPLNTTTTAKSKVSVENKIVQNLNKAKTLNEAKGATAAMTDDDFDALYSKIKGYR